LRISISVGSINELTRINHVNVNMFDVFFVLFEMKMFLFVCIVEACYKLFFCLKQYKSLTVTNVLFFFLSDQKFAHNYPRQKYITRRFYFL
jgi:hypothetical protein